MERPPGDLYSFGTRFACLVNAGGDAWIEVDSLGKQALDRYTCDFGGNRRSLIAPGHLSAPHHFQQFPSKITYEAAAFVIQSLCLHNRCSVAGGAKSSEGRSCSTRLACTKRHAPD
jgi:hypothetical protein